MNIQKSMWNTLKMKRKRSIGCGIRNNPWIITIMEGEIEGRPGRRRPKSPFMEQVMKDTRIQTYSL